MLDKLWNLIKKLVRKIATYILKIIYNKINFVKMRFKNYIDNYIILCYYLPNDVNLYTF